MWESGAAEGDLLPRRARADKSGLNESLARRRREASAIYLASTFISHGTSQGRITFIEVIRSASLYVSRDGAQQLLVVPVSIAKGG